MNDPEEEEFQRTVQRLLDGIPPGQVVSSEIDWQGLWIRFKALFIRRP